MVILMDVYGLGEGSLSRKNHGGDQCDTEQMVNATLNSLELDASLVFDINDFNLYRLANGFFGEIFKAEHKITKKTMVIKEETHCNEDCSLLKEVDFLRRLSHPNIVRFIGICIKDNKVSLITEFVNGGNLEELLMNHEETLNWATRVYLARDIASGMAFLHQKRFLHRDLTSKNCLIKIANGERYGIVADLGLATELPDGEEGIINTVGSPYNMAPEVLRGEMYNGKADVFSYGIILCEIIGRVLADPEELPRTGAFGLDVEKFSTMVGDCPIEFVHTAICCCQMDPKSRPSFMSTVKHLDLVLLQYPRRPDVPWDQAIPPPMLDDVESNNNLNAHIQLTSPRLVTPAVLPPEGEFRTRSHTDYRRRSWIASRYKLFHAATEELLKNTPSKLMGFFRNVIGIRNKEMSISKGKKKDESESARRRRAQSSSVLPKFSSVDICHTRDNDFAVPWITIPPSTSCPGSPGPDRKDAMLRRHTIAPLSSLKASSDLHLNLSDTDYTDGEDPLSARSAFSESISMSSDISSLLANSTCASHSTHSSYSSQPSGSRDCESVSSGEEGRVNSTPPRLICSQMKTPHLDRSGSYSVIDAEALNREELEREREKEKATRLGDNTPTNTRARRRIRSPLFGFFQSKNRNKNKDN
ncbi:serine/threonine-protein kinase GIN4 [Nematostella vectensis]|uniref:serine/threonine-protein kinase GIN4 n=1 Tax=Nematostella vectensis TaxID=45351 RepID=UPI0020779020|nr:serine/threonine-protein kinase GIN4 [Nematostella vectensis]